MEFDSQKSVAAMALTRRQMLGGSAAMLAQLAGFGGAAATPRGAMTLAWHTAMTPRWLDPQDHDGSATTDNFLMALHDALIKNSGTTLFDYPALAEARGLPRWDQRHLLASRRRPFPQQRAGHL
jgi:hypothetical protein